MNAAIDWVVVTYDEAVALAEQVRREHPVIKRISVAPGEGVWRYFYRASDEKEKDGSERAPKLTAQEIEMAKIKCNQVVRFTSPRASRNLRKSRETRAE
ncbi:hypothetical protein ABIF69_004500 [Bradyrhizobium japonicum]